ncbi:MAG: hypothetical protein WC069_02375 [Candidatus Shapirobacteria bacterium]
MKKIILLAATIYLLIAPFTYHPDTKLVLYYATLGNEKVWNIYKYLNENIDSAPKFHYPPMNYWLLKAELPLVKLVGGSDVVKWLATGSNIAFLDDNIFLYNLATKLPLLLMILLTGFVLYKIAKKSGLSENRSRFVALIWYLNPITLFSGVVMGQNDILAILPFIIALYFYFDYPILAFFLFGLASSVKSFPLIWAIAVAGVYPTKNWFKKIFLALIPITLYLITILPFLKFDYFKTDVLNSGLAMRMFELKLFVPVVPALLVITTLIGIKNNLGRNLVGLSTLLVAINLVVLGFSNFNPQWFIWLMPFLAILLAVNGGWFNYFLILISLMVITLLFDDKFLYWGLVSPINPSLINLPYISELFNIKKLNTMFHLVLELITFYWLYKCVKFKK